MSVHMGVSRRFISIGLGLSFLAVLAASGPHRTHHLGQEIQALLKGSVDERHEYEHHEGDPHENHPEDPRQEQGACALAAAGGWTQGCEADGLVFIHVANEADPRSFQDVLLIRDSLFSSLSPRAPPAILL